MSPAKDHLEPVPSITSAPEPLSQDIARRTRVYLWQMGVRVLCLVAGVLTWGHIPVWLSVLLLVGAVVLPYTAMLFANAAKTTRGEVQAIDPRVLEARAAAPGLGAGAGAGGGHRAGDGAGDGRGP